MKKKLTLDGVKVLLVEDDDFLSGILRSTLADFGAQLYVAADAKSAIGTAEMELPDVIMTDLMLSGMSGEEFITYMKQSDSLKHIPIIVFTNKGSEGDKKENLARGATAYHVKSLTSISDIPDIIHDAIKQGKSKKKAS
jgi:CheY-like chemotaxis protein